MMLTALLLLLFATVYAGEKIYMTESALGKLGIELYKVKKEPVGKLIKLPAEVRENPLFSYSVYSPVEGIVRKLYVKEGDHVRKGDSLAEIYSPKLADLIGEIHMAKVRTETARKMYERNRELYNQRVIQYTRFFSSMIEYERAKGEYEALKEKLRSYGEVKGYHLVLKSPGEGYVVSQNVVLGESVGLNRKLFDIHSHKVLWVYGWADERSAKEIREGMHAKVISTGGGLSCLIDYIGHEVDEKTRRVKVRCVAKNRNHLLRPGMFVKLEIKTGGKKAIIIPKSAVQDIEGKKVAFVWKGDGFEAREVSILRELSDYYVVKDGIKEGEEIAISGTVFLKTKLTGVQEEGH